MTLTESLKSLTLSDLKNISLIIFVLIILSGKVLAQDSIIVNDSTTRVKPAEQPVNGDTLETKSDSKKYDPGKAALYSAVLPGLGQAYNKKYWKIPIIYAGFAGFMWGIDLQNGFYQRALRCLRIELDGDPDTTTDECNNAGEETLKSAANNARRDRDYLIILTAAFYGLNIIDAHIDAHLKEFEVNEDLAFKLQPSFETMPYGQFYAGIGIKLTIK